MNADTLRYRNDLEQAQSLLEQQEIKRVIERLEKQEAEGSTGLRRQLLATSVRLSRKMAPDIYRLSDECVERLSMDTPLELYVFNSAQFNAMCFKPEEGRVFVMFSSSLLEGFSPGELQFVMGHEFGHHIYNHHEIPIGYIVKGRSRPDPALALKLFAWSRNAEVSADRAGAYCANDLHNVASALFKLSSGLTGNRVQFDLDEFLRQVSDMEMIDSEPDRDAPRGDWFSTHPFSPLRVKAIQLFFQSTLMQDSGISVNEMDVGVQRLMSLMEPSYLEARSDAAIAMRNLLFAAGVVVADMSDGISDVEIDVFERYFEAGDINDKLNIDRIREQLPQRVQRARDQATETQCMQVLRDVCVIATADGSVSAEQRNVLNELADGLGVSRTFICQTLEQDCEPD